MIEVVVLDLDDTLYLERDYVRSGFSSIAAHLEGLEVGSAETIFEHLWNQFELGRRRDAFDNLIEEFPTVADVASVESLVKRYRDHSPTISLAEPDSFLRLRGSGVELALISDGHPQVQQLKLDSLGVGHAFSPLVLTGKWGRAFWKPHHRAFELIETAFGLYGTKLAYVADNPSKDFIPPNERGWLSVRLRMPGQLHEHSEPQNRAGAAQMEVASVAEILEEIRE